MGGWEGREEDSKGLQEKCTFKIQASRGDRAPSRSTRFGLNGQPAECRGGRGRGGRKARAAASLPHGRRGARARPTPIPGEGAELGREPPLAPASSGGVRWSPEAGREGRSCFPFGPPHPQLRPRGPARRMEAEAGGQGQSARGRTRLCAKKDPVNVGGRGALGQEAGGAAGGTSPGKFVLGDPSRAARDQSEEGRPPAP